ncbi:MAG: tetratricopeptide repeat protein [Magnetovibrionaceae bacterium]
MADQSDHLLREIDEDLRNERMEKLWKKYGGAVIGLAVLIVVVVAGYQGWQAYDRNARAESAETFVQAQGLARAGDREAARNLLSTLGASGAGGYPLLAKFREATLHLEQNNPSAARSTYDAIIQDGSVDGLYQDLARVLSAMVELDQSSPDLASVESILAPVLPIENAWSPAARELMALVALARGERNAARDGYQQLADDPTTPPGLRSRANEMLTVLDQD